MNEIAARRFYQFLFEMNEGFIAGGAAKAIEKLDGCDDIADVIHNLSDLCRQTQDEVFEGSYKVEGQIEKLTSRLISVRKASTNLVVKRSATGTTGAVVDQAHLVMAEGIAELLENGGVSAPVTMPRETMIAQTEKLIADVSDWDLEDYAKKALIMKLNSLERIIQASDIYSENELRLRVKAIVADFAVEFAEWDKEHQTMLERLKQWARVGFFGTTTVLGLTSDVSAVIALLPGPKG